MKCLNVQEGNTRVNQVWLTDARTTQAVMIEDAHHHYNHTMYYGNLARHLRNRCLHDSCGGDQLAGSDDVSLSVAKCLATPSGAQCYNSIYAKYRLAWCATTDPILSARQPRCSGATGTTKDSKVATAVAVAWATACANEARGVAHNGGGVAVCSLTDSNSSGAY